MTVLQGVSVDFSSVTKAIKDLKDKANGIKPLGTANSIYDAAGGTPWEFSGDNWYQVFAYQFVVQEDTPTTNISTLLPDPSDTKKTFYYTLPIPPQAYTAEMVTASQASATLGGVVEETGSNVFWMIQMSGTTGTAITRRNGDETVRKETATVFRDKISTTGLLSAPMAGIQQAISKVGGVLSRLADSVEAANEGNVGGALGGLTSAAQAALLPNVPYAGSAVNQDSNGFTEAMEMQRFFYAYSKAKEKNPNLNLYFRNYKTGQQWRCIIQNPKFQQSVQEPMLIRYAITLKAWDVSPITNAQKPFDRFGPNGDLKEVLTISASTMANLKNHFLRKITG